MNVRLATAEDINRFWDARKLQSADTVFVLEDDGIIAVGGFQMIVPSCAWCWIHLADAAKHNLLTLLRTVNYFMGEFVKDNRIARLQAFVKNNPENVRFVRHLGFEFEGMMKGFYRNEDALLYRKLFQWE